MDNDIKRFFTPNKKLWKIINNTNKVVNEYKSSASSKKMAFKAEEDREEQLEHIVDNSNQLMDFALSFTKTVVRLSFVLFMVVNVYILIMISINYFQTLQLSYLDTLITESYGMLRDVIAAYIIKAATENSLKIVFSVLSDFLDRKYNIDLDKEPTDEFDDPYYNEDPNSNNELNELEPIDLDNNTVEEEEENDGGIDIIK